MDPNTGRIKAMANYPSYDPAAFNEVEDFNLFNNPSVSDAFEPGSVVKTLTTAAALDTGAVTENASYFDPGEYEIDGFKIENVVEVAGSGTRSISDILRFSLNTGATYLLMQMGGGEINQQARETWHRYMTDRYGFGSQTGIEQGFEGTGLIPDPNDGFGLDLQFANTTFGQGMTVTPLQMVAALSAAVNGGTYYQPTLIYGSSNEINDPVVVRENVVSPTTSRTLIRFMNNVVDQTAFAADRAGYSVGGKTGTAQIPNPEGGYFEDRENGTYVGFVGGDRPEYTVMVRANEPGISGYAGSQAARPIFTSVSNMLIDNFSVPSISN